MTLAWMSSVSIAASETAAEPHRPETADSCQPPSVQTPLLDASREQQVASGVAWDAVTWPTVTWVTALAVAWLVGSRAFSRGLLGDELLFMHAIARGLSDGLMAAGSSHPPLQRIIVGAMGSPHAVPDWLLRLPSVVVAVASVFVWSRLLTRLVEPTLVRSAVLVAVALNPAWLHQAFQCLPYSPLVFFSTLHFLAWVRYTEQPNAARASALVLTATLLPWTHFYGVNLLVTGQLIWCWLLWTRSAPVRHFIWVNVATLGLTAGVIPLAMFFVVHDARYPFTEFADFGAEFISWSSWCFSTLTLGGIGATQPWFAVVYVVCIWLTIDVFVRRQRKTSGDAARLTAVAFFLAGFGLVQLRSALTESPMWPRYMLAGTWAGLPLVASFLLRYQFRRVAGFLSAVVGVSVISQLSSGIPDRGIGSDYALVARHLDEHANPSDRFLVQSVAMWSGDGHFDQLWLRRYTSGQLQPVSGPHRSRPRLNRQGLQLFALPSDVRRVWLYSHLFKADWLRRQETDDWRLAELRHFGSPFPLALFERRDAPEQQAHRHPIDHHVCGQPQPEQHRL